jgi:predicted NUDIX family phosphoesterase
MDVEKARERVLVVPEARFREAGLFHGFRPFSPEFLESILEPSFLSFRPRSEVESDPSFKQLIPYVALRFGNQLFHYSRSPAGTEKRLESLRSIGIGGHICHHDGQPDDDAFRNGMLRELNEEVEIGSPYREHRLGFIYDDRTPVGEVHLGIVYVMDLERPMARPIEPAIAHAGFASIGELLKQRSDFETWSQFTLDALTR